jgi:hypothetical protein
MGRAGSADLPDGESGIFFKEDWTGQIRLKWFSKFGCARTPEGGHLHQSDGGLRLRLNPP